MFGHSLGARIAFELIYTLQSLNLPTPSYFFASGSGAPHLERVAENIHKLPEDEFVLRLQLLNGTPKEVLLNPELLALLIPMLRADFEVAETYQAVKVAIKSPILVLYGEFDIQITVPEIEAWAELSSIGFSAYPLPGDHFFIHQCGDLVVEQVRQALGQ